MPLERFIQFRDFRGDGRKFFGKRIFSQGDCPIPFCNRLCQSLFADAFLTLCSEVGGFDPLVVGFGFEIGFFGRVALARKLYLDLQLFVGNFDLDLQRRDFGFRCGKFGLSMRNLAVQEDQFGCTTLLARVEMGELVGHELGMGLIEGREVRRLIVQFRPQAGCTDHQAGAPGRQLFEIAGRTLRSHSQQRLAFGDPLPCLYQNFRDDAALQMLDGMHGSAGFDFSGRHGNFANFADACPDAGGEKKPGYDVERRFEQFRRPAVFERQRQSEPLAGSDFPTCHHIGFFRIAARHAKFQITPVTPNRWMLMSSTPQEELFDDFANTVGAGSGKTRISSSSTYCRFVVVIVLTRTKFYRFR